MKSRRLLGCVALGIMGILAAADSRIASANPRPAGEAFSADKGKFRILQDGKEAGTEEFSLQPAGNGWVMQDETVIRVSGSPEMRTSGELRLSGDGTPQHYT